MTVMQSPLWIGILFAFIGSIATAKTNETSETTSSTILTSAATLSNSGVTFSDKQPSTAFISTSLNDTDYGTSTTARQTRTSATTSSTILTLTTSLFNSGVIFSNTQSRTTSTLTSWNGTDYETTPARNLSVTSCYNKDACSNYGLNCSEGRKIRIMEAEYRVQKTNSCQSGSCLGNCCPLDENDCREDYSKFHAQILYQQCSGKKDCRFFNTPQSPNYNCTAGVQQYIQVKYQCIKETGIIDICDSSTAVEVSEVNIMLLKKTLPTSAVSRCTCQVQSKGNVNFELVDIRFFTSSEVNGEYNCTSGNLTINNRSIGCDHLENNFTYMRSKFIGEIQQNTNDIRLIYTENNKPAMVWINLKGSNITFTITCTNHSSATTTIPNETDTTHGKYEDGNSVSTIIGVAIAVIIVIAVVVAALIIFKWRQKKREEDNTHISDLPKGLTNHMYENSTKAGDSKAAVEKSNYDIINDESVLTCSLPDKNKKDTTRITARAKKYGDVSADKYDKIEFDMKGANKASSYATLPAVEGKIGDLTYSHISNQLKSVTTARVTANEYSHCKLNGKDMLINDDDYSHVGLEWGCKKNPAANISEEDDSYNHIDFEDTTHPIRHEKAVILEKESESEKNPPTCMDDKSLELESKNYPLKNGDTGVCSIDEQHQGIKAVSLTDNNNELSSRSKEQQYTAVVKVKKMKKSNGMDGTANENSESRRPYVLAQYTH